MTETFSPPVAPSASGTGKTTAPRVRRANFGDGYSQRSVDGLNAIRRTVTLQWAMLSSDDADTIETFLNARGGSEAFLYTLPLEDTAYKWTNGEVKRGYLGADLVSLSVDLTQEFDLGGLAGAAGLDFGASDNSGYVVLFGDL